MVSFDAVANIREQVREVRSVERGAWQKSGKSGGFIRNLESD
jgi:hypothetical protein